MGSHPNVKFFADGTGGTTDVAWHIPGAGHNLLLHGFVGSFGFDLANSWIVQPLRFTRRSGISCFLTDDGRGC